jgi:PAS domain S-box-containing protein
MTGKKTTGKQQRYTMTNKNNRPEQTTELRKKAEKIARKKAAQSSENLTILSLEETQQTLHELRVHQIELEMQNEELRRAQVSLDEAMERYFDLYNFAPIGYFTISEKGLIIEANLTFSTLLGVEKTTLIKTPFTRLIHPDDQDVFYKHRKQVLTTDTNAPQSCELRMVKKDGTKFWVRLESTTVLNNDGRQAYRIAIIDITERKKADEIISQSEEKFRIKFNTLFDDAPAGIALVDKNGIIQEVNNNLLQLLSIRKEKLIGRDFAELVPSFGLDVKENITDFKNRLAEASSKREITFLNKNNNQITITVQSSVIKSGDEIHGVLYVLHDITERKKAEGHLKNSEEQYRNLIDLAPDSIVTIDLKGYITSCNMAATHIFHYSKDDLVGKHYSKIGILRVKDIPKYLRVFVSLLQGKSTGIYELTINDKDGTARIVETHIGLIKENNKITGILAVTRDITERKKAEEALCESQEKYRLIAENTNDLIIITNLDKTFRYVSPSITSLGYTPDELVGQDSFILLHPEDKIHITSMLKQLIIGKYKPGTNSSFEYRLKAKSGVYYNFETTVKLVKDESGKHALLSISRDITERKKAEENLRQSEERFRILFDSSPELIIETDDEGNILAMNPMMAKSIGGPSEKLIGKNIFDIFPKEVAEERAKIARTALKEMKNLETEDERAGKYFHNIYVPVLHADGKRTIQTIVRDITEKKKTENALQESEEKYRFLFNKVPIGISIIDESGYVVDCNQQIAEIFRWTFNEFKAMNVKSLYVNPEDREQLLNILKKEGKVSDWECSFKRKDGSVFYAILNTDIIEIEGQRLILTTLRDITERKETEEKIKKQNVQLKKLDGVKTDFLNTTSHELRTPVASIKGYIQMLLKHTLGDITEEQKKALEVTLRNTNRLDALIEDILDISRLESGTMKFIREKTDVTKMINEVAETMQTSADVKRIKINSDIQKEIPELMIDRERIKQVLTNLIDNAIKFSPDGSMIVIKVRKGKEDIVFEVQDFGRGIPKNKLHKIFERFYQVDSGTDRKYGGIGLGLTISKKIIDTYGGQIWVDSTVGKGSSFNFSLPLLSTKNTEDDLEEIYVES